MLKIENLSVSYGVIKALKNVSITVKEGSITAILGANGAGKSTLLKTISGLTPAENGTILFQNTNLEGLPPEKITQKGVIHVPEGRHVFKDLSVYDNLRIGAFTLPKEEFTKTLKEVYDLFPILEERKTQQASLLSGGEQQMLAIGRGLMAKPKLLILDEPSLGLAPLIVKTIFETLKRLNKEGMTILIVEQNALQTLKIADYAYVLQVGTNMQEGTSHTLMNDPKLIEAYLGKA